MTIPQWTYSIHDESSYVVQSLDPKSYLQQVDVLTETNQIVFSINESQRLRGPDLIIIDKNEVFASHYTQTSWNDNMPEMHYTTYDKAESFHQQYFITHFHDYSFANDYPSIKAKLLDAVDSMTHMEQPRAWKGMFSNDIEPFKIVLAGVREQLIQSTVQDPFVLSNTGLDI